MRKVKIIRNNDYNIIFCKYCNIDHNAILYFTQTQEGVNELKKYTHFFYMHDTSEFKNDFYDNILNYILFSFCLWPYFFTC